MFIHGLLTDILLLEFMQEQSLYNWKGAKTVTSALKIEAHYI